MHFFAFAALAILGSASARTLPRQVTQVPINNTVSPEVALKSGGNVPNAPPPANISTNGVASFQAALYLENFEVGFFNEGLYNLTHLWGSKNDLVEVFEVIDAQEQVHVATIAGLIHHFGGDVIEPCQYSFPVSCQADFLKVAQLIGSLGLGANLGLIEKIKNTDPDIVPEVASILGEETRQDALFRMIGDGFVVPFPTPFDTPLSGDFALNLANQFIVPGTCPPNAPQFPVLPTLTTTTDLGYATGTGVPVTFRIGGGTDSTWASTIYVGWVNQFNVPAYTPATLNGDGTVTTNIPDGLAGAAFAALTNQTTAATTVDLTTASLAGPAFVQIS